MSSKPVKIILAGGLLLALAGFLYAARGVLTPFVVAFVLAYVLSPLVDRLEGRGLGRSASILAVFAVTFGCLAGLAAVAGRKATEEIVALRAELGRPETSVREVRLTNQGERPMVLAVGWASGLEAGPFRLADPDQRRVVLDPGFTQGLPLRFAPPHAAPAQDTLVIGSVSLPQSARVRVRGNSVPSPHDLFWLSYEPERGQRCGDLLVSATGVDFGQAGPSFLVSMGQSAHALQRVLQPYCGEDFDVARWIRAQVRALVSERLLGHTSGVLGGLFSGLASAALVPFIAFFLLREGRRMTHALVELVPNAYFELCLNLLHQANGQIGGYLRGQVAASSVVAGLAVCGLLLLGVPYAVPLGVLAGMANMIPFLGPLIGMAAAAGVAVATGGDGLLVGKIIVLFALIQFVDNMLVQPTVVARSVEMHPLLVLFAVLVGGQLMGILGMLVAVPLTGILKVGTQTVYRGVRRYTI
ncbi:MAG: AI-2E family transporter [Candidatus Latescibacterota bacterium]